MSGKYSSNSLATQNILLKFPTLLLSLLMFLASRDVDNHACSICAPLGQTLTEEIADAAAVLIVSPRSDDLRLEIVARIKVADSSIDDQVQAINRRKVMAGNCYLAIGNGSPRTQWKSPKPVNKEEIEYLEGLLRFPEADADRLLQFLPLLESPHRIIADDAYNEFALASVAELRELRGRVDPKMLIEKVGSFELNNKLRRVYLLLLGICGRSEDQVSIQNQIQRRNETSLLLLDAWIACYLSLAGPNGMSFVTQEFLQKPQGREVFPVLAALRFHGEEENKVPQSDLAKGMRLLLDDAKIADQVIADLTRWEDWESVDRVIRLLQTTKESELLLRRLAIQFLLACPEPKAKSYIKEFGETNPEELKRAQKRLFPSPVPIPD